LFNIEGVVSCFSSSVQGGSLLEIRTRVSSRAHFFMLITFCVCNGQHQFLKTGKILPVTEIFEALLHTTCQHPSDTISEVDDSTTRDGRREIQKAGWQARYGERGEKGGWRVQ
jgi:hypothetical protein